MKRIWRTIPDYPKYQASNDGLIRNKSTKYELSQFICNGYRMTSMWMNGKPKNVYVHRLVALAFIPNPDGLPMINHKDESRTNNHIENLEWCDAKYNCNYGTCRERNSRTNKERYRSLGHTPIQQLSKSGELIRTWGCASEICEALGINPGQMSHTLHSDKLRICHSFYWVYESEVQT